MPRKFSEWKPIRDNYFKDSRCHFYPGINSVVYQRESNNPFWENIRTNVLAHIPRSTFSFQDDRIESFVRAAAF